VARAGRRDHPGASHPGKNLGALGDGGATTDDDAPGHAAASLRNYGSRVKYE
jgi:hypothetical protein